MKLQTIITGVAFCALLLTSCKGKSQTNSVDESTNSKEVAVSKNVKKTYKLKGFKQSCCAGIVSYSLEEVDGFIKSEANVEKQELTVWYDSSKCTEKAIKKAINKTPYKIE